MRTQDTTTTVEIRDNAYWADETRLADFAEQDVRVEQAAQAEKDEAERANSPLEDDPQYAALYFVA